MGKVLSISIAAYNAAKYIEECINSLLIEEVIDKLEILIINDGSTDNILEITQKYIDKFPDTIRVISKENGGWGSTVNSGIKNATGKYFKLLDADDWYYTENLTKFVEYLEKCDTDLVVTPYGKYDEDLGRVYAITNYNLKEGQLYNLDEMASEIQFQMHALTIKCDILKNSNISILEKCFYTDVQYVLESIIFCKTMSYYNKLIYKYRLGRGGQSCSKEGYAKHYKEHRRLLEYLIKYYHGSELSKEKKKVWQNRISDMAGAQYLIYSYVKDEKRKKRLVAWDRRLREEKDFYDVPSIQAKVIRITKFRFMDFIDSIFGIIKNIAMRMGKDL